MSVIKKQAVVKTKHPILVLEDALVLCAFGRFHFKLILASFVSTIASTMITASSSYLLPNADCDLNMSIMQKGLLNAGAPIGFVLASFMTCFFVDAFGRKLFLVGGHGAIFIFTILEGSSQSYWSLLLMKVLEGASSILCLVAMLTLVAELTQKSLRNRIGMLIVSFMPLSLIGAALISWGLLPHQEWHFIVWKGYFELHAWNIYIYVCSIFSLTAAILYSMLPESPKYLFIQGKEDEALDILKNVYSENTGNDKESFPIKTLGSLGILPTNRITLKKRVNKYFSTLKQLLRKPLVYQIMLFSSFSFVSRMMYSTIRLWYPQISTIVETYRKTHGNTDRFCTMLNDYTMNRYMGVNNTVNDVCVTTPSGPETYINNIVVSLITFFAINVSGYLVDYIGHKLLMFIAFVICAVSSGALYFGSSSYEIALLVSAICACLQVTLGLLKTALTDLFPLPLRALGLSIIIMCGRTGALFGNIIFPLLLEIDCMVPFLGFSVIMLFTSALVYVIPNEKDNNVNN